MYRHALSPRWVVGHLVVIGVVLLFASLGSWQLRRLDDRRAHNAMLRERSERVVPLPPQGWGDGGETAELAYQQVRAVGRYEPGGEVLVGYRSHNGLPGYHVVTPLRMTDGVVMVNRGWVPLAVAEQWPAAEAAPPGGEVEVSGVLVPSEGSQRFRPHRASPTSPLTVGALHLPGLEEQLGHPLYRLALQLDPAAAPSSSPVALPVTASDEGRHLSYAIQWFLFAAGTGVGWLVLVRKTAHERRRRAGGPALEPEAAEGPSPPPAPAGERVTAAAD